VGEMNRRSCGHGSTIQREVDSFFLSLAPRRQPQPRTLAINNDRFQL
jgi:hypothetical protein